MTAEPQPEPAYELVMPFLPVRSKGGPHDDEAYTAGWEMGALDARLEYGQPAVLNLTIHASNREQADLLAMKHGYQVGWSVDIDDVVGWTYLTLTKDPSPAAEAGGAS